MGTSAIIQVVCGGHNGTRRRAFHYGKRRRLCIDSPSVKTRTYTPLDAALIAALALLALAAGVWMAVSVTKRIPHIEDEMAYLFQARVFARGALWAPPPPDENAFFTPFVLIVKGHWIGKYSVGWPLVLALGVALNAGWLVNPVLGALTTAVTYCLGRDLFGRQVGLIAGVLAFTSPFFLILAGSFMSHTLGGLCVAVLLWAWWRIDAARAAGQRGRGWAALAGAAVGLLAITRPLTAVAVVVPFGVVLIVRLVRNPRQLPDMLRTYWPLALTALLITLLQPLWLWVSTGSPTTNLYTMVWPYDRVGFGPGFGRDGHTLQQGLRNARADLLLWANDLYGWHRLSWLPLMLGLVLGTLLQPKERKGWPLLLAAPLVMLVVSYLAYWIGAQVYGPRYYYEAHAGLAVLAALGLREIVRLTVHALRDVPIDRPDWRSLLPADTWPIYPLLVLLLVLTGSYLRFRLTDWRDLYGITPQPAAMLREATGEDTDVLIFVQSQHWRVYGRFFGQNSPWLDGPIVAAHDLTPDMNRAVIDEFPDREVWYYRPGVLSPDPLPYE